MILGIKLPGSKPNQVAAQVRCGSDSGETASEWVWILAANVGEEG